MRRLASATRTSRTGTPTRAAKALSASASSALARGRKRLKNGSSRTGATKESTRTTSAAPGAASAGQADGAAWTVATKPRTDPADSVPPTTSVFSRSAAKPATVCVERPNRRSCARSRQSAMGNRTTAETPTARNVKSGAAAHQLSPSTAR